MSSPLESFCAETGSSTGLFHTREDFSLKNIQKMDVTADSCILELCCALHLNQAVQEFIAYNPFVESYKNVPLIRLICVTLRDVVLNKRLMNYPLAIELLESVPGLCPQIDFDFQFGSLLVDMKSQYVVHQLYTTPEVDKEEEMLSLVDAHFNSCPNWDNVGDIEDIGDLYSGAKYRLEELILSKEKRDAYWKNYILSEDSMKGIWEDVQKKFSLILSDIESKSPKPLLAQMLETTRMGMAPRASLPSESMQTRDRSSTELKKTSHRVSSKEQGVSSPSKLTSPLNPNQNIKDNIVEKDDESADKATTQFPTKQNVKLMDVLITFDQLPEDVFNQKCQDLALNVPSTDVHQIESDSSDHVPSSSTASHSEDELTGSEEEEDAFSVPLKRKHSKVSRPTRQSSRLSKTVPAIASPRRSTRHGNQMSSVTYSPKSSPQKTVTASTFASPKKSHSSKEPVATRPSPRQSSPLKSTDSLSSLPRKSQLYGSESSFKPSTGSPLASHSRKQPDVHQIESDSSDHASTSSTASHSEDELTGSEEEEDAFSVPSKRKHSKVSKPMRQSSRLSKTVPATASPRRSTRHGNQMSTVTYSPKSSPQKTLTASTFGSPKKSPSSKEPVATRSSPRKSSPLKSADSLSSSPRKSQFYDSESSFKSSTGSPLASHSRKRLQRHSKGSKPMGQSSRLSKTVPATVSPKRSTRHGNQMSTVTYNSKEPMATGLSPRKSSHLKSADSPSSLPRKSRFYRSESTFKPSTGSPLASHSRKRSRRQAAPTVFHF